MALSEAGDQAPTRSLARTTSAAASGMRRSSLRGRLMGYLLGQLRLWRRYGSEAALRRSVEQSRMRPAAGPPARLRRRGLISTHQVDGHEVIRMAPRTPRAGQILFLPGGGFVHPAVQPHWSCVSALIKRVGVSVTVPRYPLAPSHTIEDAMRFLLKVYLELAGSPREQPLALMGDSAGGGLALALAQEARRQELPMPAGLVLISPWLDATVSTPGQELIEPHDPVLRTAGLRAAATWYAGGRPLDDPWLSPLNGSLEGMPPILMFGGSHDILVTDARRLAERAAREQRAVEYIELAGLFHDWPLVPLPESGAALSGIASFVAACLAEATTRGD